MQDISPEVQSQLHSLQRNPQKVTSEKPSPEWAREYVDLLKKAVQGVEVVRDPREFRRRAAELDRQDARAFFDPRNKKAYFGPEALKDSYGHEFGHAVWIHIKETYPKFYQQGRDLIKGTDYEKNAIAQNYPDPLDEGLVQAIGEKGAKIQDAAVKNRFMAWFRRVWMKANIAMKKLTGRGLTLDEFTNDLALRMRKPGAFKIGEAEAPVQHQFGGIKAKLNVKTVGFSKEAKRMEKEGASREDIWRKTGWWRGPDGKLRFEVDVDKMKFKNWPGIRNFGDAHFEWGKAKKTDLRLSDVLDYPSLFKAYPFLRYLKLSELATTNAFGESTGNKGFYIEDRRTVGIAGDTGEKEARSILLHELQHAIQDREGFALGGSLGVPEVRERAEREIADTLEEANKQLLRLTNQRDDYLKAHKGEKDEIGLVDDFMEQNPEWEKDFDSAFALRQYMSSAVEKKIKIQKAYSSLAGEVESRTVQRRLDRSKRSTGLGINDRVHAINVSLSIKPWCISEYESP